MNSTIEHLRKIVQVYDLLSESLLKMGDEIECKLNVLDGVTHQEFIVSLNVKIDSDLYVLQISVTPRSLQDLTPKQFVKDWLAKILEQVASIKTERAISSL